MPERATEGLRDSVAPMSLKVAAGAAKPPLHLIPRVAVETEAAVLATGADKYGAWNWRSQKITATSHGAAIMRHVLAWLNGEHLDPESGMSHLAHVRATAGIILDADAHGMLIDDLPGSSPDADHPQG